MDYRYGGKRKTLALGVYPGISLADARDRRDNAKQKLQNDIDPGEVKRAAKVAKAQAQENSFKAVALEWFEKEKPHWSVSYTDRVERMLNKELFPYIGNRETGSITAPELLACLRRIESRGVPTLVIWGLKIPFIWGLSKALTVFINKPILTPTHELLTVNCIKPKL